MDNTVLPYQDESDSSENDIDESSSDDEHSHLLSNNIGVLYNKFNTKDTKFINQEEVEEFASLRNKYFTPEISKIRILVDSKNIIHTINHDTSNYEISLNQGESNNPTSGFQNYKNVIGFKLIKAILPNTLYQVTSANNKINFQYETSSSSDGTLRIATLTPGVYTFDDLGDHIQTQMNDAILTANPFIITTNTSTIKYTFTLNGSEEFYFKKSSAWRILGIFNKDQTPSDSANSITSDFVVDHSSHFVDLVIPEIPYIACKHNIQGKKIIDRIPLSVSAGSIVYYTAAHDRFDNYFYPINLSKLTIQLYEDTENTFYDCDNGDNSFEFELTILNKI